MATCLLCSKDVTTGYVLCGECATDVKLSTEPEMLEHFVEWLGAEMANDFAVKPCSMCGREHCDDISQCRSGVTAWLRAKAEKFRHDESIDHNRIIQCEACGEWFSNDVLRGEVVGGDTFCPCPHCGRDIVDGQTREEREERDYIPQYSVVVTFATGGSHGFLIAANDKRQMLGKLLDRLGENNVANLEAIHIGFLYTGGDIIP